MASEAGYDLEAWEQATGQLGITSIAIPEEYGGAGYSFQEVAIALEEAGRALFCAPLLSSVVATSTLLECSDVDASKEYLPRIAAGTLRASLAPTHVGAEWRRQGALVRAEESHSGWSLTGQAPYVLDGHLAELVLVPARTARGVGLFAIDIPAPGLESSQLRTLDQTRRLARLEFTAAPARLINEEETTGRVIDRVLEVAAVALANEQAGVAAAATDMAIQYAKDRIQFGRPIGSFQAIKHKCADLFVAVESAKSAARMAAAAVAMSSDELPELAAIAASFCSEACLLTAHENIQIHGGIGFTWEHPAQLYYKRAKTTEFLFGDVEYHREILAELIGRGKEA
jgi:alkylation response protein AidB-like acyl-CoA dehydrogenase